MRNKAMTGRALTFASLSVFVAFVLGIFVGERIGEQVGRADVAAALAPEIAENQAMIGALEDRIERLTKAVTFYGIASYYAYPFHGRRTANGEVFDKNALTAASRWLPFSSTWRVMNLSNGRGVVVRINDRGPYVSGRMIDLSEAAALALGMIERGLVRVRIEPEI